MLDLVAVLLIGYFLGSLPTSIVVGRLCGGIDIRRYGSGNAGATNIIRVIGWKPGLLVLVVDVAKGYLAVWLVSRLGLEPFSWGSESARLIAGFSAVAGHIWTIFALLRGGKGVATAAGVLLAIHPLALLCCVPVFLAVALLSRFVSLASMMASAFLPFVLLLFRWFGDRPVSYPLLGFSVSVAILIIFAHRSNIAKLLARSEPTFGEHPEKRSD